MKKITVIGAVVIMLALAHWAQGGVSLIRNGSFENDGSISPITTVDAPQYWCDVNIPSDKFNGWVDSDWWTHSYNDGDGNSLTLSSEPFATFSVGDVATVSQQVYLTDVNEIIFDLKLSSSSGDWDPVKRSAVVLIDGNEVWDSNTLGSGEYLKVSVDVNEEYKDANLHTLSLAIRSNVTETSFPYVEYRARWDFVKFDTHCGGFGYLPEDLNHDCYVDMKDLEMLAEQWLDENFANFRDFVIFASYWQDNTCQQPDWCRGSDFDQSGVVDSVDLMMFAENWLRRVVLLSDLNEDEVVNFYDFAFFAEYWTTNSDSNNWGDENCYEVELLAGDIDDSGQVDLRDVSIFTSYWLAPVDCDTRADINGDGVVNFQDFAVLAEEWWLKSWLYGL